MLLGQSFGGLLTTEIVFKRPYLFSNYVIVSPSLCWDKWSLISTDKMFFRNSFDKRLSVYIADGDEGQTTINHAEKLFEISSSKNNIKATCRFFDMENHATIYHLAVYDAFASFNKK